eukprot:8653816-Ditylum_brightwellii.AAC.1
MQARIKWGEDLEAPSYHKDDGVFFSGAPELWGNRMTGGAGGSTMPHVWNFFYSASKRLCGAFS